jgi:hypothetical protein
MATAFIELVFCVFKSPGLPSPALQWRNNPLGIHYEDVDSQIANRAIRTTGFGSAGPD